MTASTWTPPSEFVEQLYEEYGLTCPPRWGTPRRFDRLTYGPRVATVLEKIGTPPMPWQRYALDTALEIDPNTGFLAYDKVGLSVVRQQGKTALVLGVATHRLLAFRRQSVLYAAQTRNAARKKFKENFLEVLGTSPLRNRFNKNSEGGVGSLGTGQESLLALKTRSRWGITSNTEKAGHGEVLDLGIADEYFAQEDDRLEQAFGPAMITRPNAQFWYMSAAGTFEKSLQLNKEREIGRAMVEKYWATGEWPTMAYFEFSPPDGADRNNPDTWFTCMPALCPDPPCKCDPEGKWRHTVTVAKIRSQLNSMDEAGFDRAYLNITRKFQPPADINVPVKQWFANTDTTSKRGDDVAFFIDMTPVGDYASIGVYSTRSDGVGHVELVAHRPGTDWIIPAAIRLRDKYDPVAVGIDSKGPAGQAFIDRLEAAGIKRPEDAEKPKRGDLFVLALGDMTAACAQMADDIRNNRIKHRDQKQLNIAISNTRTRPVGDAWAFGRKISSVNISPFITVTGARYVFLTRIDKIVPEDAEPGAWWV